jgi:hypothetical protein
VTTGVTLIVGYPHDLIKCRLQAANEVYKYKSLTQAFSKEVHTNGVKSLFFGNGLGFYLSANCIFTAIQFVIYEKTMSSFKRKMTHQDYQTNESSINFFAGFLSGSIGAVLTNSLECICVAK